MAFKTPNAVALQEKLRPGNEKYSMGFHMYFKSSVVLSQIFFFFAKSDW